MTKAILSEARKYCETHRQRLTEPRLEVLKIISKSKKPLGAYEVLQQLGKVINNPKPPTAYRAIEFWQKLGFIHRIESLNSYVACEAGHQHQGSQFMICENCKNVTETHLCKLPEDLQRSVQEKGFTPAKWNIELHGTCSNCSS